MDILFQKWQVEDLGDIGNLEAKCFSDPWSKSMLLASFCQEGFIGYTAKIKDKLIGYIGCSYLFETADVLLIAVDEEYRKQGVATKLLTLAEDEMRTNGVQKIMLEVRVSNLSAYKCYEKLGYKKIAVRERYYGDSEDAIIMEKDI